MPLNNNFYKTLGFNVNLKHKEFHKVNRNLNGLHPLYGKISPLQKIVGTPPRKFSK